jgi:ATP-binding cassette subfamily F protein 3
LSEVCSKVIQIIDKSIKTINMATLSEENLAAMQRSNEACKSREWRFAFPTGDEPEMHGLSFHDVSFSYSPGAASVLRHVDRDVVRFHGRSRTVILGRNGSGKSTLLKLCLGIVEPTDGQVDVSCRMRHFSQHFNEALDRYPDHTAANYLVENCREELTKRFKHTSEEKLLEDACRVLSSFGLGRREAAKTCIKDLSGGQKARLNFTFLSLCPAHILILDEPTNHLDANGLEHLSDALSRYEGGIVLVSHDELLIRRLLSSSDCSELLVCSGAAIHKQSGLPGLDSYRRVAFLEQHQRAEAASKAAELRLQLSRQERRQQPRGRRRSSVSTASTREPTPEFNSTLQPEQLQPHAKDSIGGLFTGKAKRKAKPMNFNSLRK